MELECTVKVALLKQGDDEEEDLPQVARLQSMISLEQCSNWNDERHEFEGAPTFQIRIDTMGIAEPTIVKLTKNCIVSMTDADEEQLKRGMVSLSICDSDSTVKIHIVRVTEIVALYRFVTCIREISDHGHTQLDESDKARMVITTSKYFKDGNEAHYRKKCAEIHYIHSLKQYMRQSLFGSLTHLCINGVGMRQVDPRLFELHHLENLSLSSNHLGDDEDNLNQVISVHLLKCWPAMHYLNLAHNSICHLTAASLDTLFNSRLTGVDLSTNRLCSLDIQKLGAHFSHLDIVANELQSLALPILTHDGWSMLAVGQNRLIFLPGCMRERVFGHGVKFYNGPSDPLKDFLKLLCTNAAWNDPLDLDRCYKTAGPISGCTTLRQQMENLALTERDVYMMARARTSTDMEFEDDDEARLLEWDGESVAPEKGRLPPLGTQRRRPPTLLAIAFEELMRSSEVLNNATDGEEKGLTEELVDQVRFKLGSSMQVCSECCRVCSAFESRLFVRTQRPPAWTRRENNIRARYLYSHSPAVWHMVLCGRCHKERLKRDSSPEPVIKFECDDDELDDSGNIIFDDSDDPGEENSDDYHNDDFGDSNDDDEDN